MQGFSPLPPEHPEFSVEMIVGLCGAEGQVLVAPNSSYAYVGASSLTSHFLFKGLWKKLLARLHLFVRQRSYLIVYSQYV